MNQIIVSNTVLHYSEIHTKIIDPAKWHTHESTHETTHAQTHGHMHTNWHITPCALR